MFHHEHYLKLLCIALLLTGHFFRLNLAFLNPTFRYLFSTQTGIRNTAGWSVCVREYASSGLKIYINVSITLTHHTSVSLFPVEHWRVSVRSRVLQCVLIFSEFHNCAQERPLRHPNWTRTQQLSRHITTHPLLQDLAGLFCNPEP